MIMKLRLRVFHKITSHGKFQVAIPLQEKREKSNPGFRVRLPQCGPACKLPHASNLRLRFPFRFYPLGMWEVTLSAGKSNFKFLSSHVEICSVNCNVEALCHRNAAQRKRGFSGASPTSPTGAIASQNPLCREYPCRLPASPSSFTCQTLEMLP